MCWSIIASVLYSTMVQGSTIGLVNQAGVVGLSSSGSTSFVDPPDVTAFAYFSVTGMQLNSTWFYM